MRQNMVVSAMTKFKNKELRKWMREKKIYLSLTHQKSAWIPQLWSFKDVIASEPLEFLENKEDETKKM